MSLSNDDVRAIMDAVNDFYVSDDGLQRHERPMEWHDRAAADWIAYALVHGVAATKAQIRTFPEWKEKHQGETPVNPQ